MPSGQIRRHLRGGMFDGPQGKVWLKNQLGMISFQKRRQSCQVCSTRLEINEYGARRICHNTHEESRVLDDILRLLGTLETYCAPCKTIHTLKVTYHETIRLFVTSSSLAGFEDLDCGGGHRETIAVSGAKLMFLANRFRITYSRVPAKLIILVFGGMNDAVSQVPVAQFKNHMELFKDMVISHEVTHGVRNQVHFSTLFEPPCMTKAQTPMSSYNEVIKNTNERSQRSFNSPDMSERFRNKRNIWREKRPSQQLHLREKTRQELYKELIEVLQTQEVSEPIVQEPEGDDEVMIIYDSRSVEKTKRSLETQLREQKAKETTNSTHVDRVSEGIQILTLEGDC